jgi:hypothetical protein
MIGEPGGPRRRPSPGSGNPRRRESSQSRRHTAGGGAPPEVDLYELANLYPAETGLPMTVWASPRGHARHGVRVKVCRVHGPRMTIDDTAEVAVRPAPRLVAGQLSPEDMRVVADWLRLNEAALVDYWEVTIGTVEFAGRLQRLP